MDFQFIPVEPPESLRPVLRSSFFAKGRIAYRSDKILPNGLAVLIFNLGNPHNVGKSAVPEQNRSFSHSWLHGLQTSPIFNTPSDGTHVLGLLFEPIGFHALFGVDMRGLLDRTVDTREVLAADLVGEIEDCLPLVSSAEGHTRLHRALLGRLDGEPTGWLWDFYDAIKSSHGRLALADAYRATGHSPRHVNEQHKKAVGVSPKVLCRIYRLEVLLENIDPERPVKWVELAHDFGFYDQAHFNREFRKFSGLHPNEYLAQRQRDLPELGKGESVSFAPQR